MNIINQLPKSVANQIAAGEVIQRPSSIIKELVENSIDAKAKNIKIILKDAGKQSISVIDDGLGMSKEDSINCFNRHATSKLKKTEDLFKVKTMGFRCEALASIAAVSEVVLKTKMINSRTGNQITLKDSKVAERKEISFQVGTSITCKNLFYSVPARRNFLKSNNVELRHIIEEFIRCAIANYKLNFILNGYKSEMAQNGHPKDGKASIHKKKV